MHDLEDEETADNPADRFHVPFPFVVLFGCRPLVPFNGHFGPCPACKGIIGRPYRVMVDGEALYRVRAIDHRTACGVCSAMSPTNEDAALAQRIGLATAATARTADDASLSQLDGSTTHRAGRVILSEAERRRLWNGYRGSRLAENPDVTNRAAVGRRFLRSINQEPDFRLEIDAAGEATGRLIPSLRRPPRTHLARSPDAQ